MNITESKVRSLANLTIERIHAMRTQLIPADRIAGSIEAYMAGLVDGIDLADEMAHLAQNPVAAAGGKMNPGYPQPK